MYVSPNAGLSLKWPFNVWVKKTKTIHSSVISHSSMSDQAFLLPKWFCLGGIILAKGQLDHSCTFWTMAYYTTVDCLCFFDSDVTTYKVRYLFCNIKVQHSQIKNKILKVRELRFCFEISWFAIPGSSTFCAMNLVMIAICTLHALQGQIIACQLCKMTDHLFHLLRSGLTMW